MFGWIPGSIRRDRYVYVVYNRRFPGVSKQSTMQRWSCTREPSLWNAIRLFWNYVRVDALRLDTGDGICALDAAAIGRQRAKGLREASRRHWMLRISERSTAALLCNLLLVDRQAYATKHTPACQRIADMSMQSLCCSPLHAQCRFRGKLPYFCKRISA